MIVPGATWRGPIPNRTPGGMRLPSLGLVLHVIEGSLGAADGVFHDPTWRASAHWGVGKDGTLVQWVDTADKAWAEVAGNPSYHSVETEGWSTEPLTAAQVATLARLYVWGHLEFGWPFAIVDTPGQRGLITHGDGGTNWGGHFDCPGPQRSAQRSAIVAGGAQPTPTPTTEAENMKLIIWSGQLHGFYVNARGELIHQWADAGGAGFHQEAQPLANGCVASAMVDAVEFAGQLHAMAPRADGSSQHLWSAGAGWGAEVVAATTKS